MLTTFQTCHRRYRWRRLPFGTKVLSEIFPKRLLEVLGDLKGVVVIADDIIIHGETQEEHDRNLEKFLQRCQKVGIQLNKTKFQTGLNSADFMGHRVTPTGMKRDPEKVTAILDMEAPEDVVSVRRFIGTVNYLARFLPHLSQTLQPLLYRTCYRKMYPSTGRVPKKKPSIISNRRLHQAPCWHSSNQTYQSRCRTTLASTGWELC